MEIKKQTVQEWHCDDRDKCWDGLDTVSGCLWFLGCDSDLLSDEMIHQSGFTYVWTSNNRYKSGFKIFIHFVLFLINYYFSSISAT